MDGCSHNIEVATWGYSSKNLSIIKSIIGDSEYDQLFWLLNYSDKDFEMVEILKNTWFINKYNIKYILNAKFSEHENNLLWWTCKLNYGELETKLWEKFDTFISMLYKPNLWIFWWRDNKPHEDWLLPHNSEQKYVLSMEIENWVDVKFCLSTHPDVEYHSELQICKVVDWWWQRCWKIFWWWSLLRNSNTKKIYIFGYSVRYWRISPVIYSVTYQILKERFQWYDIIFWKPSKDDIY